MKQKLGKKSLRENKHSKHGIDKKFKSKKNANSNDDDELETSKRSYIKLKQPRNIGQGDDDLPEDKKKVGKVKQ